MDNTAAENDKEQDDYEFVKRNSRPVEWEKDQIRKFYVYKGDIQLFIEDIKIKQKLGNIWETNNPDLRVLEFKKPQRLKHYKGIFDKCRIEEIGAFISKQSLDEIKEIQLDINNSNYNNNSNSFASRSNRNNDISNSNNNNSNSNTKQATNERSRSRSVEKILDQITELIVESKLTYKDLFQQYRQSRQWRYLRILVENKQLLECMEEDANNFLVGPADKDLRSRSFINNNNNNATNNSKKSGWKL